MFGSWVLNEIWIIDLSSAFMALVGVSMSSSKLFLLSKELHLNSGVRQLLELYCVIVINRVTFFIICVKLTVAFTCTSLLLNLTLPIWCGFGFEQKILADRRISRKKGTDRRVYILLFTPLRKAGLHCLRSSVPLVSVNAV